MPVLSSAARSCCLGRPRPPPPLQNVRSARTFAIGRVGHAFLRCHGRGRPWRAVLCPTARHYLIVAFFSADVFSPHPHGLKPTRSPPLNRPERVGSDPSQLGGQGWPGPAVPWTQKIPRKNIFLFARRQASRHTPSIPSVPPWPSRSSCSYSTRGAGRERAYWLLEPGQGKV